ncbi:MAG: hypothetical protein K9I74_07965 [Bacteroidales bacterium]|nr:hypothetical protein [Bacteroidales bacterium]
MPSMGGVSMATVYREVWTKEVVKALDNELKDTFLDGIPDKSRYVTGNDEAQVIHSTFFGVEPDVLINNTTYPIDTQTLDGSDITISLDKYQTKATPITDDELQALAYDKIATVKDSHANAIARNRLKKAIHALAPASHAAETPVLLTTGNNTPDGLRKRLTWEDIIALREAYAAAGFPIEDLRLVLSPDHVNDLLLADTAFQKSYANFKNGIISNQLGFEIREYAANPYYTVSSKTKLSYGASVSATERQASVVFNVRRARKAKGITKMYYSRAENDPTMQRSLVNFRNYFICLPAVNEAIGAIVSDIPA